jgi:hypothetical protein
VKSLSKLRDGVINMTHTYPSEDLDSEVGQRQYQDAARAKIHDVLAPLTVDEVHFGYLHKKRGDITWWKNRYPEGHPCHWGGAVE